MKREPERRAGAQVRVAVPARAASVYDVVIRAGALSELPALLADAAPAAAYAIVTPDDVAPLYGGRVRDALAAHGLRAELLTFPAGEAHKTRATWSALTDAMLAQRLGRDSCVIALGGGVTGDVAGFVAATYMRGLPVVQVPTTLLAMIDASVGGKTGVDTTAGKNLVGAFHAPRLVVIDPDVLGTLPTREVRAGLAEAVKHGAILDASYFAHIEAEADAVLALRSAALEWLIARSVELKARIVAEDPYEQGIRAVLNFGHTIGHALEAHAHYALPHGYAIAAGMVIEAALGEAMGVTEPGTRTRLSALLRRLELPVRADAAPAALHEHMSIDKKARGARPRCVLLHRIGEAAPAADGSWTHALPSGVLDTVLHEISHTGDYV